MANDLDNPGVLILDTAAVISTTNIFKIHKLVLVATSDAAAAEIRNGADQIVAQLAAPTGTIDQLCFDTPFFMTGFELQSISGTAAKLYVYAG